MLAIKLAVVIIWWCFWPSTFLFWNSEFQECFTNSSYNFRCKNNHVFSTEEFVPLANGQTAQEQLPRIPRSHLQEVAKVPRQLEHRGWEDVLGRRGDTKNHWFWNVNKRCFNTVWNLGCWIFIWDDNGWYDSEIMADLYPTWNVVTRVFQHVSNQLGWIVSFMVTLCIDQVLPFVLRKLLLLGFLLCLDILLHELSFTPLQVPLLADSQQIERLICTCWTTLPNGAES